MSENGHKRDHDDRGEEAAGRSWNSYLDLVADAVQAALDDGDEQDDDDQDGGRRPPKPLPPGGAAPPVTVPGSAAGRLAAAALGSRYSAAGEPPPAKVIWQDADGEVLVHLDQTKVVMFPGLVLLSLTLETDETGRGQVVVPFAVGSAASPAGLLAATEQRPRGPTQLVDRWGESATAAAWLALLDLAHGLALHSGVDTSGSRLIPGAITCDANSFSVIPQARHPGDRVAGR